MCEPGSSSRRRRRFAQAKLYCWLRPPLVCGCLTSNWLQGGWDGVVKLWLILFSSANSVWLFVTFVWGLSECSIAPSACCVLAPNCTSVRSISLGQQASPGAAPAWLGIRPLLCMSVPQNHCCAILQGMLLRHLVHCLLLPQPGTRGWCGWVSAAHITFA